MKAGQFRKRMKAQITTPIPQMLWDRTPAILDGARILEHSKIDLKKVTIEQLHVLYMWLKTVKKEVRFVSTKLKGIDT